MRLVCGPHDPVCHAMSKSTKLRVKTNTSAPVPHYEKSTFGEIREVTCTVLLVERVPILGFAFFLENSHAQMTVNKSRQGLFPHLFSVDLRTL